MKVFLKTLSGFALFVICSASVTAQSCLTPEDIRSLLARVESTQPVTLNTNLKAELLKRAAANQQMLTEIVRADEKKKDSLRKRQRKENDETTARFCEILKQFGWPTKELVEAEGVTASYHILKNSVPYELQKDLLPVLLAALKKDESQKPDFAGLLDRLRVSAGMKQVFGTQAVSINGFLVLYPIEDEAHVDDRRQQYGLSPMQEQMRTLERQYQTPVVKGRDVPESQLSSGLRAAVSNSATSTMLDTTPLSEEDVIRVNTNLVNLNVSVFSNKLNAFLGTLTKDDFRIFEDGKEQTISFFASTDVPFDLVLLLDLSGSTDRKRNLIRESTQRFIQAARPSDRIAIVTFSDKTKVVSELTTDHPKLLAAANEIAGDGGSNIWDAVKFTLDNVVGPRTLERRRAVVMMTDGVDSSTMTYYGRETVGSTITFADLLEAVRQTDTLIVPIYLDTEKDEAVNDWDKRAYANARRVLMTLAEETGGSYYKARKVEDLNGVYEQIINDLGKVYSLGYKPENDKRDGTWRRLEVRIPGRPDLVARARPGYYAK